MSEPFARLARPVDPSESRIRRTWFVLAGAFLLLILLALGRALAPGATSADWLLLVLVAVAGGAVAVHAGLVSGLDGRRREETESFTRILSALSHSVSPDAIVDAIVEELGHAAGADHIVVARRRPESRVLEARLVSTRAGIPDSATVLPIADLEDPVVLGDEVASIDRSARIADRIARRVRSAYGLTNTLAAPLTVGDAAIGAIVLSRRAEAAWPEATRRILDSAAREASASLVRAYSLRAAEERAATDALTGLPNRRYFDEFGIAPGTTAARRRCRRHPDGRHRQVQGPERHAWPCHR